MKRLKAEENSLKGHHDYNFDNFIHMQKPWNWDSVVGIVTRRQGNQGIVGQVSAAAIDFFPLLPKPQDRLWGPPSFLFNGHLWRFPRGRATAT
jgi:hypothetical protein